jgi:hypothetical protein
MTWVLTPPCISACWDSPVHMTLKRASTALWSRLAVWFRGQSRCPQTNHRPCASVETRTCTNSSTECCSAKCSPSARQSLREGIQVRQSARQFQLHPDRQLTNRAAHRRANLRGKLNSLPRELAASLLSACVVVESLHTVHIAPSLDDNYSFLSGFQMQNSTEGVHFGSVTLWRASSWTAGQVRSTLVTST